MRSILGQRPCIVAIWGMIATASLHAHDPGVDADHERPDLASIAAERAADPDARTVDIAAVIDRYYARPPAGSQVEIRVEGEYRYVSANGIPSHDVGDFPNRNNPNRIQAQRYSYRLPVRPRENRQATPMRGPFGVALNGVPFDPGTAEFYGGDRQSGWNYEALSGKIDLGTDTSNAHVQPTGAYHYHGMPNGLIKGLGGSSKGMTLVGYAADGFPIYALFAYRDATDAASGVVALKSSYRIKTGTRPSGPGGRYDGTFTADYEYVPGLGDLDECNGRHGVTPEYPDGTYYYVLTEDYPFIPRLLRGTPDQSFMRGPGGGGPGGGGMRGPGGHGGPGGHEGGGRDGDHRRGPGGPMHHPPQHMQH